jgi:hypothetical protein
MAPCIKIAVHGLPDAEVQIRRMRAGFADLAHRYATITGGRFALARSAPEAFEAHVEILLPQHQVIVNAAAAAPERALREALSRARECLAALERRDASIRSAPRAKAA